MIIINRHNYEEYFLLYTDDELDAAGKRAVEDFVEQNPDLKIELEMLQKSVLPVDPIVFHHKDALLKNSLSMINDSNYEEYFVLYADDELTVEEKDRVDQFVYTHPQFRASFDLIQKAKLQPDTRIEFPDKASLYRTEGDEKIVSIRWWKLAAAAVLLLFLSGVAWYFVSDKKSPEMVVTDPVHQEPSQKNREPQPRAAEDIVKDSPVTREIEIQEKPVRTQQYVAKRILAPKSDEPQTLQVSKTADISPAARNIQIVSDVVQEKPEVSIAKIESPASIALQAKPKVVDEAVGPVEENPYAYAASDNEIEILNTSISKKSRLRGLLRKVSRVVEKTTSIEPGDGRGIRIANFEVALK